MGDIQTTEQLPSAAMAGYASLALHTTMRAEHYAVGASAEVKAVLSSQDKDIRENNAFNCPDCGWRRWTGYGYRCLYCGVWFCAHCAEVHFGQTIDEWTIKKRIEKRREIEARLGHNASVEARP